MSKFYVGTSGWQYRNWQGDFYPKGLPQKDWLRYYSKYFDTVEVNSSFYHQTRASTFKKWREQTGKKFVFAIKGNRFITHIKRLKDAEDSVKIFFENAGVLSGGKHVVLWQLPPNFKINIGRLEEFLKVLPKGFRHAFEFRHESWVDKETWQVLENADVESTAVLQDWKDWPILEEPVGKFVYMRFHGKKQLYTSNYSDSELKREAKRIRRWLRSGMDVYGYFNNDAKGYAPHNARKLQELVV